MTKTSDTGKKISYEQTIDMPLAKFDINPFIVDTNDNIVLAQRITTVQYGGTWHMPGGKVFVDELVLDALKRMSLLKTGLEIEFLCPSLNESVVGVYDDPNRDPREHVLGITFACKILGGEFIPGGNCNDVKAFSPEKALELQLAFGHDYMIKDGVKFLKSRRF